MWSILDLQVTGARLLKLKFIENHPCVGTLFTKYLLFFIVADINVKSIVKLEVRKPTPSFVSCTSHKIITLAKLVFIAIIYAS